MAVMVISYLILLPQAKSFLLNPGKNLPAQVLTCCAKPVGQIIIDA
jgi:hypothetical protein